MEEPLAPVSPSSLPSTGLTSADGAEEDWVVVPDDSLTLTVSPEGLLKKERDKSDGYVTSNGNHVIGNKEGTNDHVTPNKELSETKSSQPVKDTGPRYLLYMYICHMTLT